MVIRTPEFDEFCREMMARDNLTHEESLRVYEALHREALALGAMTSENVLDGLEVDLRIAKALNGLKP
jgi:hypothetical protein